jgi:hypothetical protein
LVLANASVWLRLKSKQSRSSRRSADGLEKIDLVEGLVSFLLGELAGEAGEVIARQESIAAVVVVIGL